MRHGLPLFVHCLMAVIFLCPATPIASDWPETWSLHDHLKDPVVRIFSDRAFVWVRDWVGYFDERRTGYFHPTLSKGYRAMEGHFGSVDTCRFPLTEAVQGKIATDQCHIHPDTRQQPTILDIRLDLLPYQKLVLAYAMADHAFPDSNGVDFQLLLISGDGERSLLKKLVKANHWSKLTYDIHAWKTGNTVFRIVAGGHGSTSHDWLKVRLILRNLQKYR
ncbi:MAG: hypothetical protein JW821_12175 [Deltaproteobacteria bacterium]|nr:hypothetical protein [Deltaproteobacteria bacterium]